MSDRQYVHKTSHDGKHHRRTAWHIVVAPLAHARTYVTLCGRTIVGDTMDELPAAASCESCLRIAVRADEDLPETKTDPAGEDDPSVPFEPTVTLP